MATRRRPDPPIAWLRLLSYFFVFLFGIAGAVLGHVGFWCAAGCLCFNSRALQATVGERDSRACIVDGALIDRGIVRVVMPAIHMACHALFCSHLSPFPAHPSPMRVLSCHALAESR